jgi:anti-anti-sigma factor
MAHPSGRPEAKTRHDDSPSRGTRAPDDAPLVVQLRERTGTTIVIAVSGEVDTLNCDDMSRKVIDLMASDEARHVSLDLSELTFLSSAGIRSLLARRDIAEDARHQLERRARVGDDQPSRGCEIRRALRRQHRLASVPPSGDRQPSKPIGGSFASFVHCPAPPGGPSRSSVGRRYLGQWLRRPGVADEQGSLRPLVRRRSRAGQAVRNLYHVGSAAGGPRSGRTCDRRIRPSRPSECRRGLSG